ncbi:hypothetical protein ACEPAF_7471 [Sanghuangporus sanghuang]
MMATLLHRQFHPLKLNPRTNEIYLQLPPPHENIIITPPRKNDTDAIVEAMNDPRVYMTLLSPPFPYLREHAEAWLVSSIQACDTAYDKLKQAAAKDVDDRSPVVHVDGCPVSFLREVRKDGSDAYLGSIGIFRSFRFQFLRDEERERSLSSRNLELPAGHPEIIWEIADHLVSSHHGRGIVTAVVRTLINDWAVPRMNAHVIYASAFTGNIASVRVFLKNGFEEFDQVENCLTIAENRFVLTTPSSLDKQMHPLKVNLCTNEVHLRLPAPHENIVITPPRMTDADALIQIMNDPRVYKMLLDEPFPFLPTHAEAWLTVEKQRSDAVPDEFRRSAGQNKRNNLGGAGDSQTPPLRYVGDCPVFILREVQKDGSDTFIGHIGVYRCGRFEFLRDEEQEDEFASQNEEFPVGSPKIIWEIGDFLSSSYHGAGIMTAAVRMIIHDWAVPRTNAHTIYGSTYSGNAASVKVFLKNGFKEFDFVDNCVDIRKSKGGGKAGVHFLVWRRPQ